MNGLRKVEGDIGKMAKQLVKSWKQLLNEASAQGERERGVGGGRERVEEEGGREEGRRKDTNHKFQQSQPSCSPLAVPPPPHRTPCKKLTPLSDYQ